MGIESIKDTSITTYKGKHYLGEKEDENKGKLFSIFSGFNKVDTDDDKNLSFEEIIEQRDKVSRRKRRWGNVFMAIGAYYCLNGIKLEKMNPQLLEMSSTVVSNMLNKTFTSTKIRRSNLLEALFFAGIGIIKVVRANKIDKESTDFANSYYRQIAS